MDSNQEVRGRGIKLVNAYEQSLGEFYEKTPKSVFAALALSFAMRLCPEDDENNTEARALLSKEWAALHHNGYVPQKPPKESR